jgi:hypothetical protein
MHFYNGALSAPDRLNVREVALCVRRGATTPPAIRSTVRPTRLRNLPDPCNGRQAAWALCLSPYQLGRFIKDGRLPAQEVRTGRDRWHWSIDRDDVLELAEELEGR